MAFQVATSARCSQGFMPVSGGGHPSGVARPRTDDQTGPVTLPLPVSVTVQASGIEAAGVGVKGSVAPGRLILLVATDGEAMVHAEGGRARLAAGRAVLVGHGAWRLDAGTSGPVTVYSIPQASVQVCASASFGGARRLSRRPLSLDLDRAASLARLLRELADGSGEGGVDGAAIVDGIIAALVAQHGLNTVVPLSRSISLARKLLDQSVTRALDPDDLAGKAGITGITLQRGFKAMLGMTVVRYSQLVRLTGARSRLQCRSEFGTIAEIAIGAGFSSAQTFVRAYQTLFGETPTQTRVRVFQSKSGVHLLDG